MKFTVHKNSNYTIMDNAFLYDKNLSFAAKGLLATMIAQGENTMEKLNLCCTDDEMAIVGLWKELEQHGYLVITDEGKTKYYDISAVPQSKVYA